MSEQAHHHYGHGSSNTLVTSAQATLPCLTDCVIVQAAGLAIGITLGDPRRVPRRLAGQLVAVTA